MRRETLLTKAGDNLAYYVLAAELVCIFVLIRLLLEVYFGKFLATVFMYPAVFLSAYACGFGPSLFAIILSCLSIRYFFMRLTGQFFDLTNQWDPLRIVSFAASALLGAGLISGLRSAKKQITASAADALAVGELYRREAEVRRQTEQRLLQEQNLLRQMIDHQDNEKQMLCNDFHDGLIQNVVGSTMLLEARADGLPADDPIHEIIGHLRRGIGDGRRVISGVRPAILDEPGLDGPLHELVSNFSVVGFEVDYFLGPNCDDPDLPDTIRTAAFRICQEALTNSWKHSGCNKATVTFERQGDCLSLEIHDGGRILDGHGAGFGLKGMDARARLLGGTFDFSGGKEGTTVKVQLPLTPTP